MLVRNELSARDTLPALKDFSPRTEKPMGTSEIPMSFEWKRAANAGSTWGTPLQSLYPIGLCMLSAFISRGLYNPGGLATIPVLFAYSLAISLFVLALGHKINQMVEERTVTNTGEVLGSPSERRMPVRVFTFAAIGIATGSVLFNEGLEPSHALVSQTCWYISGFVLAAESQFILGRVEGKHAR